MFSVLLIDGFSEDAVLVNGKTPKNICDTYLPLLEGILRFNGIGCERWVLSGIENEYAIRGRSGKNLIFLPVFSVSDRSSSDISFIYTDSTAPDSISFRIAKIMRRKNELSKTENVVFINPIHENDPLKSFSPIIVENVRLAADGSNENEIFKGIYKRALNTAEAICTYYFDAFENPGDFI